MENLTDLTTEELKNKLANKEKAAGELSNWLSRHDPKETEYKRVWDDRTELQTEIHNLKRMLDKRELGSADSSPAQQVTSGKTFNRSLNESKLL
jgi:chromosome segregation ATPase